MKVWIWPDRVIIVQIQSHIDFFYSHSYHFNLISGLLGGKLGGGGGGGGWNGGGGGGGWNGGGGGGSVQTIKGKKHKKKTHNKQAYMGIELIIWFWYFMG